MLQRPVENKIGKGDALRQGIISDYGCMVNCIKLRINTKDKCTLNSLDNAIAHAYGNKFIIPLDFEMVNSEMPYYQSETDYVIKFHPTTTEKLLMQWFKHQLQMPRMRSLEYKIVTSC